LAIKLFAALLMALALHGLRVEHAAAQGDDMQEMTLAINTMWVLLAGTLVFFMQAGFALLEAGFVRAKNATNILMENFIDTVMTGIGFWAIGFGLMFGAGNNLFGTEFFFGMDLPATFAGVSTEAFLFFQFAFAAAASTIATGAMAERTNFKADLAYSFAISVLIYPVIGHWIWGGGWLADRGFSDFAGSTVVHSVGGYVGLVGTLVMGARKDRSFEKGAVGIPGHNIALATLGTFILWVGWFGFNPGSTLSAMAYRDIAKIALNSNLAACAGALAALAVSWWRLGVPQLPWGLNGALAGLVAITAPCAWVTPAESILIGTIGALLMYVAVLLLERLKIDDPVGAVPVHVFGGVWGTLAVGLFAVGANGRDGLLHGGGTALLGTQVLGIITVAAFVLSVSALLFNALKVTIGLRLPAQAEITGLDVYQHGMVGYPEMSNSFSAPVTWEEPKTAAPGKRPELAPRSSPVSGD
jgi:Amt family ammonium transporter